MMKEIKEILKAIKANSISNIAISLCHSALFADHELEIREAALYNGMFFMSVAHIMLGIYPPRQLNRTSTACLEAYLAPIVKQYLCRFKEQFEGKLCNVPVYIMQSEH